MSHAYLNNPQWYFIIYVFKNPQNLFNYCFNSSDPSIEQLNEHIVCHDSFISIVLYIQNRIFKQSNNQSIDEALH